jgi:ribosomal protein L37AE/L43A
MGKYPRRNRTEAQQAAINAISQRSLVKIEGIAFYDAINGLPPDAPSVPEVGKDPAAHYRKCHEYARVAWQCFTTGTRPSWEISRNAIFRRYEAKLKQIGTTYLSTLTGVVARPEPRIATTPARVALSAHEEDKENTFTCESCDATLANDQLRRVHGAYLCRKCAAKQAPEPPRPAKPTTPPARVAPQQATLIAPTAMPILSPQPAGTVPDEACPAYREYEAAMTQWEKKCLGEPPRPEHFADMLWIAPKPKPRRTKPPEGDNPAVATHRVKPSAPPAPEPVVSSEDVQASQRTRSKTKIERDLIKHTSMGLAEIAFWTERALDAGVERNVDNWITTQREQGVAFGGTS